MPVRADEALKADRERTPAAERGNGHAQPGIDTSEGPKVPRRSDPALRQRSFFEPVNAPDPGAKEAWPPENPLKGEPE
jgi:hypothetical protein